MNDDQDTTRIVRAWLRQDEHESADHVVRDVLALLDGNTQRVPSRPARWIAGAGQTGLVAFATAAVVVVTVAAATLLPSLGIGQPPNSSAAPTPFWATGTEYLPIEAGAYEIPWARGQIRLTVPAGWMEARAGFGNCIPGWARRDDLRPGQQCALPQGRTTLTRFELEGDGPRLSLSFDHDVENVPLSGCGGRNTPAGPGVAIVGPTVDDLVTALQRRSRGTIVGPSDVLVGGYPAKALVVTSGPCVTNEGYPVWHNTTWHGFEIPADGVGRVWVVDVSGERLVITSPARDASAADLADVAAMIASISITIEPVASPRPRVETVFGPDRMPTSGRFGMTVAGVPLSIEVTRGINWGWTTPAPFYIAKSLREPQGAEAAILFSSFPDPTYPYRCVEELPLDIGTTAGDLAAAVAHAPADPAALTGPTDVTVGGRPALYVEFIVGDDHGCAGGFFYTWPNIYGGTLWGGIETGDTIQMWIVDVDGTLLVFEGMLHSDATPELKQEVQQFIDSIRFE